MIDRVEFGKVLAYIVTASGKPMPEGAPEVYYDLLGDLPLDVLREAARKVVLEHKWATFPNVAELREAAVSVMRGDVVDIPPAEAWRMARRFAASYDPDIQGPYIANGVEYPNQFAFLTDGMPPLVLKTIRAYGVNALAYSDDPEGVMRGQFVKFYDQLQQQEKRDALLPASVKENIAAIRSGIAFLTERIGVMPKET